MARMTLITMPATGSSPDSDSSIFMSFRRRAKKEECARGSQFVCVRIGIFQVIKPSRSRVGHPKVSEQRESRLMWRFVTEKARRRGSPSSQLGVEEEVQEYEGAVVGNTGVTRSSQEERGKSSRLLLLGMALYCRESTIDPGKSASGRGSRAGTGRPDKDGKLKNKSSRSIPSFKTFPKITRLPPGSSFLGHQTTRKRTDGSMQCEFTFRSLGARMGRSATVFKPHTAVVPPH
nr:hypothetical protein B24P11.170 [imported] - Neurospora crassa [Neurospora crassa]